MSSADREQPVTVDVGPCRCPGTPHATDTVTLRAKPDMAMRFAIIQAIREAGDDSRLLEGYMTSVYLRTAPIAWSMPGVSAVDLPDVLGFDRAMTVAERAGELYTEAIIAPLVPGLSNSQAPTPTSGSTSQSPASTPTSSEPPSLSDWERIP